MAKYAFVTLVTSDYYLSGALTLAASIRDVHSKLPTAEYPRFDLVCVVTPATVKYESIERLMVVFDVVLGVEALLQQARGGLELLGRPDLSQVLSKLHIFRLTQYEKVVYLDADVILLQPLTHLFALDHDFAAVPDIGWPDAFNSGVMAFRPTATAFAEVMDLVQRTSSWDGGDQGILNDWRKNDWHRLSFLCNVTLSSTSYESVPALERYGSEVRSLHFIGAVKPWSYIPYTSSTSQTSDLTVEEIAQAQAQSPGNAVWMQLYDKYNPLPAKQTPKSSKKLNDWEVPGHLYSGNQVASDAPYAFTKATTDNQSSTSVSSKYRNFAIDDCPEPRRPKWSAADKTATDNAQAQPFFGRLTEINIPPDLEDNALLTGISLSPRFPLQQKFQCSPVHGEPPSLANTLDASGYTPSIAPDADDTFQLSKALASRWQYALNAVNNNNNNTPTSRSPKSKHAKRPPSIDNSPPVQFHEEQDELWRKIAAHVSADLQHNPHRRRHRRSDVSPIASPPYQYSPGAPRSAKDSGRYPTRADDVASEILGDNEHEQEEPEEPVAGAAVVKPAVNEGSSPMWTGRGGHRSLGVQTVETLTSNITPKAQPAPPSQITPKQIVRESSPALRVGRSSIRSPSFSQSLPDERWKGRLEGSPLVAKDVAGQASTRYWDPVRSVDIFRGSTENALGRFLEMGLC